MKICADKWHRVQFDIKVPEDIDIDDLEFIDGLAKTLGATPSKRDTYIDGCKVWVGDLLEVTK